MKKAFELIKHGWGGWDKFFRALSIWAIECLIPHQHPESVIGTWEYQKFGFESPGGQHDRDQSKTNDLHFLPLPEKTE